MKTFKFNINDVVEYATDGLHTKYVIVERKKNIFVGEKYLCVQHTVTGKMITKWYKSWELNLVPPNPVGRK